MMPDPQPSTLSEHDLDYGPTLRGLREGLKVFGRYTLVRMLGRGGMGVVWLARDEKLDLDVALKFLPETLRDDKVAVDDLRRETKRCLLLTHDLIVRTYDLAEDDDMVAIAMEYVAGSTLAELRLSKPARCFEAAEIEPWLSQVCGSLTYAHEDVRMVHRDLKPSNIMLNTATGRIKLADFGIASSLSDTMSRMTRAGDKAGSGTLVYMSPQQLMGFPPAISDDIYSLGATLYELLTSRPPFFRGSIERQIESVQPPSMAERRAELGIADAAPIPKAWETLVAACLEKEAEKRPQSAQAVLAALNGQPMSQPAAKTSAAGGAARAQRPQKSVPKVPPPSSQVSPRSTQPLIKILATLFVIAGTAAGWWFGIEAPQRARLAQQQAAEIAAEQELARLTAEKAEAEEKLKQMAAQAEATRLAREKADAEERQRQMAAAQAEAEAARKQAVLDGLVRATQVTPFQNSLGMRFVPVPINGGPTSGQKVLFSVWDTRVKDYGAYIKDNPSLEKTSTDSEWNDPAYSGNGDLPVVYVSWEEAKAFCLWLTRKDLALGKLPQGYAYRLPTDHEWSCAVGIGDREDPNASLHEKSERLKDFFPWGSRWPPPDRAGNLPVFILNEGYEETSPVGSFPPNEFGLHDMAGNVLQWCEDWYDDSKEEHVLRGSSWRGFGENLVMMGWRKLRLRHAGCPPTAIKRITWASAACWRWKIRVRVGGGDDRIPANNGFDIALQPPKFGIHHHPLMRAASNSDAQSWIEFPEGPRLDLIGSCTIGRAMDNLIRLSNDLASRQHALIHRQEQYEFWLVDLGSRNGTLLNGRRLSQPVRLRDGDVIEIAGEILTFRTRAFAPPKEQEDRSMDSTRFDVRQSCCWLMVADIVDSSKLARELPAEVLPQVTGTWFKACRRIIEKHGGSMSKYLGDGFLSYWIDSADTPQQLIQALQELSALQQTQKPPFRVVVHRGLAVLRGVPTMSELNLHGPEVNFVFRMEKVAGRLGYPIMLSKDASTALNVGSRASLVTEEPVLGFEGSFRFYSFQVTTS